MCVDAMRTFLILLLAAVALTHARRTDQEPQPWINWAQQQTGTFLAYTYPQDEREIVDIVQKASTNGQKVSVSGGQSHSFNRAVVIDVPQSGYMIDLRDYNRFVRREGELFTFQAGISVLRALEILDTYGYTIPNHSGIMVQSLAGMVNTNTHGTGNTKGVSGFVEGVRLVTSNGTVLEANSHSDPELLAACIPGAGVMGVFLELTVRAVPQYNIRRTEEVVPVRELLDRLPTLHLRYERFSFYWNGMDSGDLAIYEPTQDPVFPPDVGCSGNVRPCVDIGYKAYGYPDFTGDDRPNPPLHNTESFLPVINELEYINGWIDIISRNDTGLLHRWPDITPRHGIRYVRPEFGLISQMYYQDTMAFDMSWNSNDDAATDDYLERFADLSYKYNARMHWGKQSAYTPEQTATVFPAWDRFQAQRRRVDPTGVFLNSEEFIGIFEQ